MEDVFNICFPGEKKFAKWFFDKVFNYRNTLVYEENGTIIAALQMIPVKLTDGEKTYTSSYLYGVGTLPEYRSQGIMGKVIEYSFEEDKKNGTDYSILIVQEDSLLDYYSRFGFEKYFSVSKKVFDTDENIINFRPVERKDFAAINKVYEDNCAGILHAVRDERHCDALYDMYAETSFVHETDGVIDSYVFGYFTENSFNATECIGINGLALANSVAVYHSKKQYKCTFPGNEKYIGMIKNINESIKNIEGYINLLYN
ncbi:MAG: GNAT family N-acetyltransferase [Clostridia bacterium]|nr:GNAT family N-acetyltransferase [Clostridia bacterium]